MYQKLEGVFVGWQSGGESVPTLQLHTPTLAQTIQVGKGLYPLLADWLQPGMRLVLHARVKRHRLKAKFLMLVLDQEAEELPLTHPEPVTVKVCTHKHCCKRGAKDICAALEQLQQESPMALKVKSVGCLGACSQGPVVKIDDRQYRGLSRSIVMQRVMGRWQERLAMGKTARLRATRAIGQEQ